jgi:hypothetical protein
MSAGTLSLTLGTAFDQIAGSGGGTVTLSGGTLLLDPTGAGFSYGATYAVFSGFSSVVATGITISGYDTINYTASLDSDGVLSFAAVAVPELANSSLLVGGLALAAVGRRRFRLGTFLRRR